MDDLQIQEPLQDDDEIIIDFKEVFYMLLNNWKKILLAILIGAALSGACHIFFVQPSYRADTVIYITNTDSAVTYSDVQLSDALADDYTRIIKSRTALKQVIKELQLELNYKELGEMITVSNPDSTHIIEIQVTCDDPEQSRKIANSLLNIGVKQIQRIFGNSKPTVIDYSEADTVEEVTPSLLLYLIIGAGIGLVLVCGVLFVRLMMDTALKTEEEIMKYLNIPVLSSVPYYREQYKRKGE